MDAAHVLLPDIQLELRQKGQNHLLDRADMPTLGIEDMELMSPGGLPLHREHRPPAFIVYIITVEPGE